MQYSAIRSICAVALAIAAVTVPASSGLARGQDEGRPLISTAPRGPAPIDARSVAVSYADLNLLRDEGVAQLNGRVKRAAGIVCDTANDRLVEPMQQERRCFAGAMSRAKLDIAAAVAQVRSGERLAGRSGGQVIRLSRR